MPLDYNNLKREYASYLAGKPEGYARMDGALLHVLEIAYHAGINDGAEAVHSRQAALIHYPEHWDTAAYPTPGDAVHEALACVGCSECRKP